MTWCNWAGNVCAPVHPIAKDAPSRLRASLEALVGADPQGRELRPIATAYSTGQVVAPSSEGHLLDLSDLRLEPEPGVAKGPKILGLDDPRFDGAGLLLSTAQRKRYAKVSASARIHEVNDFLDARGRSMPMMGAFSGQTLIGAMSTSTHGSGYRHGTLADEVVSIDLLTVVRGAAGLEVAEVTVEPESNPITHGSLRSDALFEALRVGLGAFGFITSVVVKTVPRFWLEQTSFSLSWTELVRDWLQGRDSQGRSRRIHEYYNAGVLIVPYLSRRDGKTDWHNCTLSVGNKHTSNTPPPGAVPATRNRPADFIVALGQAWMGHQDARALPSVIDAVMSDARPPPRMFDVGHRVLADPAGFPIKGVGIEYAFDMDAEPYLALHAMLVAVHEEAQRGRYLPGFFSIRFGGPSAAHLAMSRKPTCIVEVLSLREIGQGESHVLPRLEEVALDHGGRANWGLGLALGDPTPDPQRLARIRALYEPELTQWRDAPAAAGLPIATELFRNEVIDALR